MNITSPVLLIVFNRPDLLRKLIDVLRGVKPTKIYVAADGPRIERKSDFYLCSETRGVINEIDWDCKIETLFRDSNLGCTEAVTSALDWFFEKEEFGIILEDDCCPDHSFFHFCHQMLYRYLDDTRVMQVNGSNYQFGKKWGNGDYYFSRLCQIWGWATWRRAWELYDPEMTGLDYFLAQNALKDIFGNATLASYYKRTFLRVRDSKKNDPNDHWDVRWQYSCLFNNALCINPQKNLVLNIGFDKRATHGSNGPLNIKKIKIESVDGFSPPENYIPYREADIFAMKKMADITLPVRIYKKIMRIAKGD